MPLRERIMALDVGEARIGVAISDPEGIIAAPLTVIPAEDTNAALDDIVHLVSKNGIKRIVVGMPRSLSGELGAQARFTKGFIRQLMPRCNIPIDTWDERFSTIAANNVLRQGKSSRKERKERRDAVAAALILQAYLERQRFISVEDRDSSCD